jgi:valyl-tRNA synthetase
MIDKSYEPGAVETRIYETWQQAGAFAAGAGAAPGAKPYSIVIPPPNVTGNLHVGHALNNTIQDILTRFNRMQGRDVLWQPGTDHAGIATQMIVERQLMERQEPGRRDMGREKFLERVWSWKAESGGAIINQLKRLGASADWSRERFTLGENGAPDDQMVRAVTKVFVDLFNKGLIYRDKRLVNWHPGLETAISDLEVENIEINGHMWHLRYPLADGVTFQFPIEFDEDGKATQYETRDYIVVATTRPETMLGDSGVAVHPDDPRYQSLIGKFVDLPLVGRRIPIVGDSYADPALGSGAVKITPAHDFNDFEVGQRNKLDQINIFTTRATINDNAPKAYRGLTREDARTKILAELKEMAETEDKSDLKRGLDHIEDKKIMVPFDEKSKQIVIEPFLTDQWWVKADVLAQPAMQAVRDGKTKFVPQQYENTYFAWLENIRPWCISRQLWWGHQIPAWYGPKAVPSEGGLSIEWRVAPSSPLASAVDDFAVFVASSEDEAIRQAKVYYRSTAEVRVDSAGDRPPFEQGADGRLFINIVRDPDVLDTWFSSALWPFSTMGWPDQTPELARYYPTDVVVTGFDIIFFWVARMMMMGIEFMGEVPFATVYMHALVRDEKGAKMSKTKGNVIDPLGLIDSYGADATRFTFAAMAAQGRDLKLSLQRVEGYRNFVTKLWNAARFLEFNECGRVAGFDPKSAKHQLNRWIAGQTAKAAAEVTKGILDYKFNEAANAAYDFVWGIFCDWYVELSKPILTGDDVEAKAETRAMAAWALDQILALLHPFMPFVTEELWAETGKTGPAREKLLVISPWPDLSGLGDAEADAELGWLIDLISGIRSVRQEMNVPVAAKIGLQIVGATPATMARAQRQMGALTRLARLETVEEAPTVSSGSAQIVLGEANYALPLAGVIDFDVEKARLTKDVTKLDAEIAQIDKKLGNEQFVSKAPEEVIEEQKARRAEAVDRRDRILAALALLN